MTYAKDPDRAAVSPGMAPRGTAPRGTAPRGTALPDVGLPGVALPGAAAVFAALGDPTRREIFERVATRPQSVGELAEALPVSRPAVSQHLRVLREAGLVSDGAAGTRRIYRMNPQGLDHLRAYLDHFWSRSLAAFKTAAEQPPHKESRR